MPVRKHSNEVAFTTPAYRKLKATRDISKREQTQVKKGGKSVTGTCSRSEPTQIPVPEIVRTILLYLWLHLMALILRLY